MTKGTIIIAVVITVVIDVVIGTAVGTSTHHHNSNNTKPLNPTQMAAASMQGAQSNPSSAMVTLTGMMLNNVPNLMMMMASAIESTSGNPIQIENADAIVVAVTDEL